MHGACQIWIFFFWRDGGGLAGAVTSPLGGLGGFGDGLTGISWSVRGWTANGRAEWGGMVGGRWQIGGRGGRVVRHSYDVITS